MKKALVIVFVFAFVLAYTTPLFAIPESLTTVKDNVVDIISSPLEVTTHATEEMEAAEFKPFGLMGGILKGSFYMVKKAATGVVNIVTLPLNLIK